VTFHSTQECPRKRICTPRYSAAQWLCEVLRFASSSTSASPLAAGAKASPETTRRFGAVPLCERCRGITAIVSENLDAARHTRGQPPKDIELCDECGTAMKAVLFQSVWTLDVGLYEGLLCLRRLEARQPRGLIELRQFPEASHDFIPRLDSRYGFRIQVPITLYFFRSRAEQVTIRYTIHTA
jgi:hypothetical protein